MNSPQPDADPGAAGWEITGNHALAFPAISRVDGGIQALNVLCRAQRGLIEWAGSGGVARAGSPLLAPRFAVDGEAVTPLHLQWERLERWIPRFGTEHGAIRITGTLCAPPGAAGASGAVYLFEIENRHPSSHSVDVTLEGEWCWSLRHVGAARPVHGENRVSRPAGEVPALCLEPAGGLIPAALAVVASGRHTTLAVGAGPGLRPIAAGEELASPNGEAIRLRVGSRLELPARGRGRIGFYLAAAPERDGAVATAAELRRTGGEQLLRDARIDLTRLSRRTSEPAFAEILNRNLLFNFFCAVARAVDDDRLYPVSSRCTSFSGGPLFRERDALFWSLPALTMAEPPLAREMLLRCFEQYSHYAGEAERYLDGGVFRPGFALDGALSYGIALERYVRETGDESVLDEPIVHQVLAEIDAHLLRRLHPEITLAATELLPSGSPADHPYVTYDNALLWLFCGLLSRIRSEGGDDRGYSFADAGEEVASAVWRHAVAELDGLRVLAWSIDAEGESAIYDDPAGSLQLLPYLGFCEADDPIWTNTVELLRSRRNPFWLGGAPFPGRGSRERPGEPSLAGLCSDMLGAGTTEALALLRRLPLDDGLASATYDSVTGLPASGRYHAALAGFLAWSLWHALEAG